MPITWRNVNNTVSGGGGGRDYRGAQDSFDSGFGALQKALEQRQTTQSKNWDTRSDNNTQDFMNRLAQYGTPEEFQAAQASGELQQAFQGHGRQIDQDAARTAMDNRLGVLQQRQTQTDQYDDATQQRENRDKRGKLFNLMNDGKVDEANAYYDENRHLFVDQEGIRRDLRSDEDSHRSELRSQAGELRNVESQGWRRENQQDTRNERAIRDENRENLSTAEDLMAQTLSGLDRREQGTWGALNDIGRDLGLPMTENGDVDTNALTPEQQEALQSRVGEAGVRGLPSHTELVGQYEAQLADTGDYSPVEISTMGAQLDAQLARRDNLATQDAVREEQAHGQVDAQFAAEAARNPFIQPEVNTHEKATELVQFMQDPDQFSPWGSDNKERRTLITKVEESLNEGLPLGEGGERIRIPPGFAERVVSELKNVSWNTFNQVGDIYEDRIKELLEESPHQLGQLQGAQTFEQRQAKQRAAASRAIRGEAGQSNQNLENLMNTLTRDGGN